MRDRLTNRRSSISRAIPAVNFGVADDFSLGIEDELFLVDPVGHGLVHRASEVLALVDAHPLEGRAVTDAYAGMLELLTPVCSNATEAAACIAALRQRLRAAGATPIGAGLHPTAEFGDVVHAPGERYQSIAREMRGLQARTPTCALHVHVAMPDAETAIQACNALRVHLPLLQALAANSPFWYGRDSSLASARAQMFRAFPRSEIPPAYDSFDEYAECVTEIAAAGGFCDYTFLWWDIRPHPLRGTVEVRAMDSQSSLGSIAGLGALVQGLAAWAAEQRGPWERRQVLMESSFRAARDGLDATLWHRGALRAAVDVARDAVELARPYAMALGSEEALEEIERLLVDGNGAARQRAAFRRGGLRAVLVQLVEETARPSPAMSQHGAR
jgi:carboxylate-amine ligase